MKELAYQFLEGRISRRGFIQTLTALGVSSAGIKGTVSALEAVSPLPSSGREVRGTGGELMVEQMKAAGVQYLFTNAIVVSENLGGSSQFLSTGFRDDEKTWLTTSGVGLGWGIGASVGAKLGQPDRQVVCDIGDGSVMYSASGFWTHARYGVPVLTVVSNNRNYQTVRLAYARYNGQMKRANRYTGVHLGDPNIDFVQLAGSQGVEGARVETSADLVPALRRGIAATNAGQPYLLEVIVTCEGDGHDSTWHQEFNLSGQG